MKEVVMLAVALLVLAATPTLAQQQTRYCSPNGSSLGTSVPYGNGSRRFYDARGNTLGTSTTVGRTTTFYDARGNVTGRASR
jgi:YD repeat-containing protein